MDGPGEGTGQRQRVGRTLREREAPNARKAPGEGGKGGSPSEGTPTACPLQAAWCSSVACDGSTCGTPLRMGTHRAHSGSCVTCPCDAATHRMAPPVRALQQRRGPH